MSLRRSSLLFGMPLAIALLAAALAFFAWPAAADSDHAAAKRLRESGEILPLEQILERAYKQQPGKVLETELDRERGRYLYEIEVLDANGKVWELKYDARSGELLRHGPDD